MENDCNNLWSSAQYIMISLCVMFSVSNNKLVETLLTEANVHKKNPE